MFNASSNLGAVVNRLTAGLSSPQLVDGVLRSTALAMNGIVHKRVHMEGVGANGQNFGVYSANYMRTRRLTGRTYPTDPVITLQFTGQMERDFTVGPTTNGWALGFNNPEMYRRMRSLVTGVGMRRAGFGPIYELTDAEAAASEAIAQAETVRLIPILLQ